MVPRRPGARVEIRRHPDELWATDYPHPDGFFPGAPELIAKRPELSEETKRKVLAEGAIQFYKLREWRG